MDTPLQIVIYNISDIIKNSSDGEKRTLAAIYLTIRGLCSVSRGLIDYVLPPFRAKSFLSTYVVDDVPDQAHSYGLVLGRRITYYLLPNGKRNGWYMRAQNKGAKDVAFYLNGKMVWSVCGVGCYDFSCTKYVGATITTIWGRYRGENSALHINRDQLRICINSFEEIGIEFSLGQVCFIESQCSNYYELKIGPERSYWNVVVAYPTSQIYSVMADIALQVLVILVYNRPTVENYNQLLYEVECRGWKIISKHWGYSY